MMLKKVIQYLNPIGRLGDKKYSLVFPPMFILSLAVSLEIYASVILGNPDAVGIAAIFIFVAAIIYLSFRDGIRGGFIATVLTLTYYCYIVYSRGDVGERGTQLVTIIVLGVLYLLIAFVIGWLKQTIDTLIEKEADEKKRLQAVVQQLPAGVVISDNEGYVIQANKLAETLFGRKIPDGSHINEIHTIPAMINGKPISPTQWPLTRALAQGKSVVGKEIVIDRGNGKSTHLQISASLIRNSDNKIIAVAKIINDISAQKEMEERKDDFVNMASHELKTPITSMKLYIDSLRSRVKTYEDEKGLKTLNSIKTQADRLQELVNDLLDVSRLQTGKLRFNKQDFIMNDLISDTISELKGSTRDQRIIFAKRKNLTVNADKFRIYQVVTNLITNAIKYSPPGTNIKIDLKQTGPKVLVSVADEGIGIDKDQLRKVFDRLYQVTDSKEKTFPGLGMGLFISKEIIKRHKGSIWVESVKGKGSTFYFNLPQKDSSNGRK